MQLKRPFSAVVYRYSGGTIIVAHSVSLVTAWASESVLC